MAEFLVPLRLSNGLFFRLLSYCLVYLSAILFTMDQMVERARWRTRAFTHNCTGFAAILESYIENILTGSRIAATFKYCLHCMLISTVGFFPTQQKVTGKQSATHFFINYACIIAFAYAAIKKIQYFTPSTLETERHFCSQGRCGEL